MSFLARRHTVIRYDGRGTGLSDRDVGDFSIERCVEDRDGMPDAQTLDVYFHEWTRDPDTVLREIYRRAGLPLTDANLSELHAYLEAHEHGASGKIVYNLQRDFGVSAAEIRSQFDFYFKRFAVAAEVT